MCSLPSPIFLEMKSSMIDLSKWLHIYFVSSYTLNMRNGVADGTFSQMASMLPPLLYVLQLAQAGMCQLVSPHGGIPMDLRKHDPQNSTEVSLYQFGHGPAMTGRVFSPASWSQSLHLGRRKPQADPQALELCDFILHSGSVQLKWLSN